MSEYAVMPYSHYQAAANAIRSKNPSALIGTIKSGDFANQILAIPQEGGGTVEQSVPLCYRGVSTTGKLTDAITDEQWDELFRPERSVFCLGVTYAFDSTGATNTRGGVISLSNAYVSIKNAESTPGWGCGYWVLPGNASKSYVESNMGYICDGTSPKTYWTFVSVPGTRAFRTGSAKNYIGPSSLPTLSTLNSSADRYEADERYYLRFFAVCEFVNLYGVPFHMSQSDPYTNVSYSANTMHESIQHSTELDTSQSKPIYIAGSYNVDQTKCVLPSVSVVCVKFPDAYAGNETITVPTALGTWRSGSLIS